MVSGNHRYAEILISLSYFIITAELIVFIKDFKMIRTLMKDRTAQKRQLLWMILGIFSLFALFIAACGATHLISYGRYFFPDVEWLILIQSVVAGVCAFVSVSTAVVGLVVFPLLSRISNKFELNSEGKLKHLEDYLIETLELLQESIVVVSGSSVEIKRGNKVSANYFGENFSGSSVTKCVHPEDAEKLTEIVQLMSDPNSVSLDAPPTATSRSNNDEDTGRSREKGEEGGGRTPWTMVFAGGDSAAGIISPETIASLRRANAAVVLEYRVHSSEHNSNEYIWVESTIRRRSAALVSVDIEGGGSETSDYDEELAEHVPLNRNTDAVPIYRAATFLSTVPFLSDPSSHSSPSFPSSSYLKPFDLVMITRDISARKHSEELQGMYQANQEKEKLNEGKLRYISNIAHDLKTPLQSFSFAVDTLTTANLTVEQIEVLDNARVSSELMKLTISQTQEIGKMLTGGKLTPRRGTVELSSLLKRVDVIIKGFGTQVPISYRIASDVGEYILSDEEWLWQMLLNLLTNASKYTDEGSIHVAISLSSSSSSSSSFSLSTSSAYPLLSDAIKSTNESMPRLAHVHLPTADSTQRGPLVGKESTTTSSNNSAAAATFPPPVSASKSSAISVRSPTIGRLSLIASASQKADTEATNNAQTNGASDYGAGASACGRAGNKGVIEGGNNASSDIEPHPQQPQAKRAGPGTMLLFQVFDTGVGVSEENMKSLFQPFTMVQAGQTQGTGLGLYGLRCRVQCLGGRCGVRKNEFAKSGSVFWFKIPYIEDTSFLRSDLVDEPLLTTTSSAMEMDSFSSFSSVMRHFSSCSKLQSAGALIAGDTRERGGVGDRGEGDRDRDDMGVDVFTFPSITVPSPRTLPIRATTSSLANSHSRSHSQSQIQIDRTRSVAGKSVDFGKSVDRGNALPQLGSSCSTAAQTFFDAATFSFDSHAWEGHTLSSTSTVPKTTTTIASSRGTAAATTGGGGIVTCIGIGGRAELTAIVVDDVLTVRKVMERMLKQLGFTSIECYPNGKKGLDAMKKKEVDIVFSDVQMPIMSGPEMAQRFRVFEAEELLAGRRSRRQMIVAVTANGDEFHDQLVAAERFDRMFPKPVNTKDVHAAVIELLGGSNDDSTTSSTLSSTPSSTPSLPFLAATGAAGAAATSGAKKSNGDRGETNDGGGADSLVTATDALPVDNDEERGNDEDRTTSAAAGRT